MLSKKIKGQVTKRNLDDSFYNLVDELLLVYTISKKNATGYIKNIYF